jgi:hypothetical protein
MGSEKVEINGKILQYGVLSNDTGYQVYTYPGMTVAELAFNVMVTIKLLLDGKYIKTKKEFDALVTKYFNDPQYAPVKITDKGEREDGKDRG